MATGELIQIKKRQGRWGKSCVLQARDNALAIEGVQSGDYLVVDCGSMPHDDDALVVVKDKFASDDNVRNGGPYQTTSYGKATTARELGNARLLLRKYERFGSGIRLQPGNSPRRRLLIPSDSAGIWGTVVAVMRKFEDCAAV